MKLLRRLRAIRTPVLCSFLFCVLLSKPAAAAEWLLSGDLGVHDPTIIKENGDYENGNWWWCAATGMGLSMKYSLDGVRWRQGVQFFNAENKPAWWTRYAPGMKPLNIWSPNIRKFGDRYWCYYCVSEFGKNNSAIGLTSASGIFRGDWRDDGVVVSSKQGIDTFNAVDPDLVTDNEGKPWFTFGSYYDGFHIVPLDPETMKPAKDAEYITIARRRSDLGFDGPSIIFHDGYYYLFCSVDICCNGKDSTSKLACGRSKNITGPYEGKKEDPANAVSKMITGSLTVFEKGDDRWAGVGGLSVYRHGDGWLIARHGYDKFSNGIPKLRINDLYWDRQGWPTLIAPDLQNQSASTGKAVTFTAPASISYRWQVSTDNGATWSDIENGPVYGGAKQINLTVKAGASMNGVMYRVVTGNGGATSNAATLTVSPE